MDDYKKIEKRYIFCPLCENLLRKRIWMSGMLKCQSCHKWFDVDAQEVYFESQLSGLTLPE